MNPVQHLQQPQQHHNKMAQTVLITLAIAGTDTGPFDLYSDANGFSVPFESGIAKALMLAGYTSTAVPNAATQIMIKSNNGLCQSSLTIPIVGTSATTTSTTTLVPPSTSSTTSTTSSTSSTTSSTSTTISPCKCYMIQDAEGPGGATGSYTDCNGDPALWIIPSELGQVYVCTRDRDSITSTDVISIFEITPFDPLYINCPC